MKKLFAPSLALLLICAIVLLCSSCGNERSTPPVIAFAQGSSFIFKDTILTHGTIFNIGILASKTGTEGILTSGTILKSVNGSEDSVIQKMNFFYQSFAQVYSYTAADSGVAERYTFSVTKQDGLSNSVSLTITGK